MYNHYDNYNNHQIDQLSELVKTQCLPTSLEVIFMWPQVIIGFSPKPYSGDDTTLHPNIIVQLTDTSCWHLGEGYMDGFYKDVVSFGNDWNCKYPKVSSPKDYFEFPTKPTENEWNLYLLEFGDEYSHLHPRTIAGKLRTNYFNTVYGGSKC